MEQARIRQLEEALNNVEVQLCQAQDELRQGKFGNVEWRLRMILKAAAETLQ